MFLTIFSKKPSIFASATQKCGRLENGWLLGAAACQPIAYSAPRDFRVRKMPRIFDLRGWKAFLKEFNSDDNCQYFGGLWKFVSDLFFCLYFQLFDVHIVQNLQCLGFNAFLVFHYWVINAVARCLFCFVFFSFFAADFLLVLFGHIVIVPVLFRC